MSPARSLRILRPVQLAIGGVGCRLAVVLVSGCKDHTAPTTPTSATTADETMHMAHDTAPMSAASHGKMSPDKGYIDGWFDGDLV